MFIKAWIMFTRVSKSSANGFSPGPYLGFPFSLTRSTFLWWRLLSSLKSLIFIKISLKGAAFYISATSN